MKILAIESSCDETAVAIVEDGKKVLSNVVFTQIDIHTKYGGVVPEIASRHHIEKITYVIEEAIQEAGLSFNDIDDNVIYDFEKIEDFAKILNEEVQKFDRN